MGKLMEKSTSQFDISDKNLIKLESKVLRLSGLRRRQMEAQNVRVGEEDGQSIYMRTVICDSQGLKASSFVSFDDGG